jgi:glutamyl-tRNA reductase
LSESEKEAIEILTASIIKKLLHDPIVFLKKKAQRSAQAIYMDFTQQLFNLAEGASEEDAAPVEGEDAQDQTFLKTAKK